MQAAVEPIDARQAVSDPEYAGVVLTKALINAGKGLGLSQSQLGAIVGRDRSSLGRGLDPESKAGELALLVIRCYRSLYALVGGDAEAMRHWMHTGNRDTGGVPAEQLQRVAGLVQVVDYLDALRGHG
jgi:hypothetical protein